MNDLSHLPSGQRTCDSGRFTCLRHFAPCGHVGRAIAITLFIAASGLAADVPHEPHFTHISLEDGLSQSTVFSIGQDNVGYLWFGTEDGLNKFDGYTFTVYRHDESNPHSLTDNWVRVIFFDRDHRAWIGTDSGLNRYDPYGDRFFRYLDRDSSVDIGELGGVSSIEQDPSGDMWVGTFRGGLVRLDPDTEEVLWLRTGNESPQALRDNRVRCLAHDGANRLWVGTKDGVTTVDTDTLAVTHIPANAETGLSHREVRTMLVDWRGRLWAGTTSGLNLWDDASQRFIATRRSPEDPHGLRDDWINFIAKDRDGYLWIGTRNGGLHHFDVAHGTFEVFSHEPSIPDSIASNNVLSFFEDTSGVCWVGTYLAGISKFNRRGDKFRLYRWSPRPLPTLIDNTVRAIHEDHAGNFWIGTLNGLTKLNAEKEPEAHYRFQPSDPDGLRESQVLSIGEDRTGRIWLGTYGSGIDLLDPGTSHFTHLTHVESDARSLSDDFVQVIRRDEEGRMWVGTRKGLNLFIEATQQFEIFRFPDARDPNRFNDSILTMMVDSKERYWLGTYGGGLVEFNPHTHTHRRIGSQPGQPHSLNDDHVTALLRDAHDRFWLGTWQGLSLMDEATRHCTHFNHTERGNLGVVHAILEGAPGQLWLSTNQGLVQFRLLKDGSVATQVFDRADGVQGNEFNIQSACRSSTGELFFGGTQGMNSFFPDHIHRSEFIPPIVLTTFRVFDRDLPIPLHSGNPEEVTLTHADNFISFEFAALDYTYPSKNIYKYKLEGFDKDWNDCGARRYASYTNLDGGRYTFRVQGANHDGVWNQEGLSLPIHIIPPLWQRPWFIAACVVLIGCIVFWRQWDLRQRNVLLDRRVKERTTDLRRINRELVETQNQLVRTAHQAGMAEIASQVLHNIGNAVNGVMISADLIRDQLAKSQAGPLLRRFVEHMERHSDRLNLPNQRTTEITQSLVKISQYLDQERRGIADESDQIQARITHIKEIITTQQEFAMRGSMWEVLDIRSLVEDVMKLQAHDIAKAGITLVAELDGSIPVRVQKSSFLQVMMNVVKNAIEAFEDMDQQVSKTITIAIEKRGDRRVIVAVSDNGIGLHPEAKNRIFSQGFTSKERGFGLGLHFCANAMAEMSGTITASSPGPGKGSVFQLELPIAETGASVTPNVEREG